MARLTIVIPDDVTKELRIRAVEVYDGEKGALGKAVTGRYPYLVKAAAFSEEKIAVVSRNTSRRPPGVQIPPVPHLLFQTVADECDPGKGSALLTRTRL